MSSIHPPSVFEDTQPVAPPRSLAWPEGPRSKPLLQQGSGELTSRFSNDAHGTLRLIREGIQLRIQRRAGKPSANAVGMVGLLSCADIWIKELMSSIELNCTKAPMRDPNEGSS